MWVESPGIMGIVGYLFELWDLPRDPLITTIVLVVTLLVTIFLAFCLGAANRAGERLVDFFSGRGDDQ